MNCLSPPSWVIALAVAASGISPANSQTSQWNVFGAGNWADADNWTGGLPGASTQLTLIEYGGPVFVDRWAMQSGASLVIGAGGWGRVAISSGGFLTSSAAVIARDAGGDGAVEISGGIWSVESLEIARAGTAVLTVAGGHLSAGTGIVRIATEAGSSGVLNFGGSSSSAPALPGALTASAIEFGAGSGKIQINTHQNLTIESSISGPGSLEKRGNGTTTLSGETSFTGGITVLGGTLKIGNNTAGGMPGGTILNNALLEVSRSDDATFNGSISGTGIFRKSGDGTLVLTGSNTYSGITEISGAGNLQLGDGGTTGWIQSDVKGGRLAFHRSDDVTFARTLNNVHVIKKGENDLTLTGAVDYSLLTIEAGTLRIGDGGSIMGLQQGIQNSGALIINHSNTFTLTGQITGNGSFTKEGSGALVITSGKSGTGVTTISQGSLEIAQWGSLRGDVVNNASLVFNQSSDRDLFGNVSGSGTLTKRGAHLLIVSGNLTHTGLTTVEGGALQIGQGGLGGSIAGDIENNATVIFHRANTLTYGGQMTGTGNLVKKGGGTLELTGDNAFSGGTLLQAGTLSVSSNGLGSGALQITGGSLAVGKVGTIGTLHLGGLDLSSGGTIVFELNGRHLFDQLDVAGDIVLSGGTLRVLLTGGSVSPGDTFDLIDWTGSLSGIFFQIDLPALPDDLAWDSSALLTHGILAVVAVPEPASLVLLAAAAALLGLRFGRPIFRRK